LKIRIPEPPSEVPRPRSGKSLPLAEVETTADRLEWPVAMYA